MKYIKDRERFLLKEDVTDPEGAPKGEGSTETTIDTEAIDENKKPFVFDSKIQLGKKLSQHPVEVIKNEPMFFNCTWNFAYENGGEPHK